MKLGFLLSQLIVIIIALALSTVRHPDYRSDAKDKRDYFLNNLSNLVKPYTVLGIFDTSIGRKLIFGVNVQIPKNDSMEHVKQHIIKLAKEKGYYKNDYWLCKGEESLSINNLNEGGELIMYWEYPSILCMG